MNWQALFEPQILFCGEELFEEDKVISFEIKGSEIFAEVESSAGEVYYEVYLCLDQTKQSLVAMTCDCPYAESGRHCKYAAATAFCFYATNKKEYLQQASYEEVLSLIRNVEGSELRAFLLAEMAHNVALQAAFLQRFGKKIGLQVRINLNFTARKCKIFLIRMLIMMVLWIMK